MLPIAFPRARFLVRLDGGFATPELFDILDAEPGLDYVVAMAENAVMIQRCVCRTRRSTGPCSFRLEARSAKSSPRAYAPGARSDDRTDARTSTPVGY